MFVSADGFHHDFDRASFIDSHVAQVTDFLTCRHANQPSATTGNQK